MRDFWWCQRSTYKALHAYQSIPLPAGKMEISDRSNEENDEIEEVTIEFGNFDNGNEIGNVETSFGEVAAPTGGD